VAFLLSASRLAKTLSTVPEVRCTYRCEMVTLECPANFCMVNASALASPHRVRAVWRMRLAEAAGMTPHGPERRAFSKLRAQLTEKSFWLQEATTHERVTRRIREGTI
jgi:hypothetical protein